MLAEAAAILENHQTPQERIDRFRELMRNGEIQALPPEISLTIYSAMHRLGEVAATEKLAEAHESGLGTSRNLDRADRLWRGLYRRHFADALRGSRWAMLKLGDAYAFGRGCPPARVENPIQSNWRLAWSWWLKAAKSHRPYVETPSPNDFTQPLDDIAQYAVLRLANALEFGKGRSADNELALSLYQLAGASGNADAAADLSNYYWRQGRRWINANEQTYGNDLLQHSSVWLKAALEKESAKATLSEIRRIQFHDISKYPDGQACDFKGAFCPAATGALTSFFNLLKIASKQGASDAYLIRALRLVTMGRVLSERFWDPDIPDGVDVVALSAALWRSAENIYPLSAPGEARVFANRQSLLDIQQSCAKATAATESNINEFASSFVNLARLSRAYCPSTLSGASAHVLIGCLRNQSLEITPSLINWVVLRSKLADLEEDAYAYLWHELAVKMQLHWPQSVAAMRPEGATRQRLKPGNAAIQAVAKSTIDVGPVYNMLDDSGVPIPGTLRGRYDGVPEGWMQIQSIRLRRDGVSIEGQVASSLEMPFVFKEDIDVLMLLVWVERFDPSLSLEPIVDDEQAWCGSGKFFKKIWNPAWLSETLLGKTFYYTDHLLWLHARGRSMFSLHDPYFTAESACKWTSPNLWRLADDVGGSPSIPIGRFAHIPIGILSGSIKPIGRERGDVIIPIPKVRAGVEGAIMASSPGVKWEDRRYAQGNLRFRTPRAASLFTDSYDEMIREFPVYARSRALFGIHAGLTRAFDEGVQLSDPLISRLVALRKELVFKRQRRLDRGGVDIVLSGR